ncbi:MAG: DUF6502 family protein [Gammaproteobacteria bacterium]|nr:DUF6502 family protein [Gammaproteobacteria bacterium]MDH4314738.1 DUF6502 family protein [Gammaproteobacteria bacterium]MDH5212824.1 DUF6502 family protein [Gammaproteobacteria bacterium]MDH5501775.1 DUF6502 family protein [Gammaproteobacteria bacterium]
MDTTISQSVDQACRLLLRPVAALLMKCGVTWKQFSDLSKSVFVEVASREFGIRGRPTNVSRVSILTGISRKEIKHQRDLLLQKTEAKPGKTNDATRLLSGWHQDPLYSDGHGAPLTLPERGPAPSFETLFQRYGGDTPFQTLMKELKSAGTVEFDERARKVVAKSRFHMPVPMSEENIRFFGSNLFDHARTLEDNVSGSGKQRRFEGFAVDDRVDPGAAKEFHAFLNERGQQFLEEIDEWLNQHRVSDDNSKFVPIRLGVGLYAIDGQLPEGKQS